MKKVAFLLVAAVAVVLVGCSNNEKKAQKLINHQLKITLHDFSSYESVEFSKLDSTFSEVYDLPEYQEAFSNAKGLVEQGKEKIEDAKRYGEFSLYDKQVEYARAGKALLDSASIYYNVCNKLDSLFVSEFVGWNMAHTFRANNAGGNKVIAHRKYYFDKNITEIVKNENLDDE